MFVETLDGDFINIAHVVSFSHDSNFREDGRHIDKWTMVKTTAGDWHKVYGHVSPSLLCPIVPAEPNFFALVFWTDGKSEWVDKHPVLAWRIRDNGAWPITADPELEEDGLAVLYPDNRVLEPFGGNYSNYAAWLLARREAYRRRLAADTQA